MSATGTLVDLPVITENSTYSVVLTNADKKADEKFEPVYKVMPEDAAKKFVEESKGTAEITGTQSFKFYNAKTDEGVKELVVDEGERVKMFNRGIDVKQQNKARALLLATDSDGNFSFDFTTDAYDMRDHVSEITQSRGKSELEKLLDRAKNLPPDQQKQLLAALGIA